jgi:hypothetical protein
MCDSQELLVGYIYDELSPAERQALQAHLVMCGECRAEIEGLRATRTHLALWSPPEPDLGFRVIRGGGAPAPALPRRTRLAPAFTFAAAAVVVLAAGAAIANVEVKYGSEGLVVRTGWAHGAPAVQGADDAQAASSVGAGVVSLQADAGGDLAELHRRLREIETALTRQPAGTQTATAATALSDAEMLRQVRRIVSEAEARRETAVAHRLLQVVRDLDQQRRTDIAQIRQGLDQYQGMTNVEIAQSRDMFNQWIRASARQEK